MEPANGAFVGHGASDTSDLVSLMLTCYISHASNMSIPTDASEAFESTLHTACHQPVSYAAAMRSPQAAQWIAAMEEEKAAFFNNGSCEIVDLDPSWNLLSSKWVFKVQRDGNGTITRYRARLVSRGFLQREGIDYGDIFSPVVRYSTLRIVLALSAHYGLYERHLDCPKAFTQADLDIPCL